LLYVDIPNRYFPREQGSRLPFTAISSYHHPMEQQPPLSPDATSWVFGANNPDLGLPLQHLPYCAFTHPDSGEPHLGAVIGACVLDLHACATAGLLTHSDALKAPTLNPLMALGPQAWSTLRSELQILLRTGNHLPSDTRKKAEAALLPTRGLTFVKPVHIPNYTDFYASIHHATRVGRLFRPDQPLLPNYKHIPIGYHGRASSIIVSDTPIIRPWGQTRPANPAALPNFTPTTALDYELELALYIGQSNPLGAPIPIDQASSHLFGLSLLNDWSARDIQSWEYQPLGPFLGKSFATSISPWITSMAALAPYRTSSAIRESGAAQPLAYLGSPDDHSHGGVNVLLEVFLATSTMRASGTAPHRLSASGSADLYWTPAQLVAHHTSNGCNLQIGDILATGTISGPTESSAGCLLELTRNGTAPLQLPNGETRTYLQDGDEITLRGNCTTPNHPPITLGECRATILPAHP
jgi:fumarylacetoacetase